MPVDTPMLCAIFAQFAPADLHTLGWSGAVTVLGGGLAAAAKLLVPVWRDSIAQRREVAKAKLELEQAEHKAREARRQQERDELAAVIETTRGLPSRVDALTAAVRDGFAANTQALKELREELRSETAERMREMHAAIVGPRAEPAQPATPAPPPSRARLASRPQELAPPR